MQESTPNHAETSRDIPPLQDSEKGSSGDEESMDESGLQQEETSCLENQLSLLEDADVMMER